MPNILTVVKGWVSKLARIGKSAFGRNKDMVRIRLRRQGSKGQPSYRIVVIDQRKARNGKYLENIGHYNPRTRPATEIIKEDRALYWLSVGAQPSDAVRRILDHTGTWERYQRLRAGESIEELVNEAKKKQPDLPSPRTNFPAPGDDESKIKAREVRRSETDAPENYHAVTSEENEQEEFPSLKARHPSSDDGNSNTKVREVTRVEADTPNSPTSDKTDDPDLGSQEEYDRPSREPDNLLESGRNNSGDNRGSAKSSETNGNSSERIAAFEEAFNQPGKTQLNNPDLLPNPLRNPDLRAERKKEEIKTKIRRGNGERKWKISFKLERNKRDTATKVFLKEQYNGKCQICDCGFTFPRRDGEPHFVAVYILGYEEIDDPANSICLCPNHFAMFKHGAKEAPDGIVEQINSFRMGSPHHIVKFQLIDQEVGLRFTDRHIIDVKTLLENLES